MKTRGDKVFEDLELWCRKINAMMIASVEGEAPQVFKAIIFAKMGEFWTGNHKKQNKKAYLSAEKLMKEYYEKFMKLKVTTSKEEAEENLYEK